MDFTISGLCCQKQSAQCEFFVSFFYPFHISFYYASATNLRFFVSYVRVGIINLQLDIQHHQQAN